MSRDEAHAVAALIAEARLAPGDLARAQAIASKLAEAVRVERSNAGGVDALMLEFSLESREGIALMCLAESAAAHSRRRHTRRADPRQAQPRATGRRTSARRRRSSSTPPRGACSSPARIVDTRSEGTLEMALASLLRKGGEPLIRKGRRSRHAASGPAVS
jgi:RHH-type proline utilization regulon transcriptional repressor/proline dehydrogenase/delta 1-pyrroline-5-carboxylate dehydrogenase